MQFIAECGIERSALPLATNGTQERSPIRTRLSRLPNANSLHSEAAKPSGDQPEKGKIALSQHEIEKLIITVRGEQVLIDQDIARLYGVTTKRLNEQAKRNSARFPSNFRFELTEEERDEVVANCDHLQSLKFRPTLPYAFTEQGIGQLSSVVHSQKAIERIILIDNFVDDRVLSMLDKRAEGVSAVIYSRYYEQFQTDLKKHNEQYPAIDFVQLPHKNHDRFLIIDDKVYLMGASLKDMGAGLCAITEMQVTPGMILDMLK